MEMKTWLTGKGKPYNKLAKNHWRGVVFCSGNRTAIKLNIYDPGMMVSACNLCTGRGRSAVVWSQSGLYTKFQANQNLQRDTILKQNKNTIIITTNNKAGYLWIKTLGTFCFHLLSHHTWLYLSFKSPNMAGATAQLVKYLLSMNRAWSLIPSTT